MKIDEDEENAVIAALLAVVGVITVFWIESLLVVIAVEVAISELILWPILVVGLMLIVWKLSDGVKV